MMPPASLTALMPNGSVRAGAGKNDGEVVASLGGERTEEKIDRRALPARLVELGDREMVIGRTKLPVGWDDIDVARFNRRQASNLGHRHFRPSGENIGELALALRVEMHDNHESGVDVVGQTFEKHLQRVDAAG